MTSDKLDYNSLPLRILAARRTIKLPKGLRDRAAQRFEEKAKALTTSPNLDEETMLAMRRLTNAESIGII